MPAPRRTLRSLLLLAAVTISAAACSQPSDDELVEALVTSGIDRETAGCAVSSISDLLTDKERDNLVSRGYGGAPPDDPNRTDDTLDQLRDALSSCREEFTPTTTGS